MSACGRSPPEVVVLGSQLERPLRMSHRGGDIASSQGLGRPIDRDRGTQTTKTSLVHHDHPTCHVSQAHSAVRGHLEPPLGILQQWLDTLELAARQAARRHS